MLAKTGGAMPQHQPARPRLEGLDLFRGLAVAGMILVNTPGSWAHLWGPLGHAEWHGFTPTDLVFPAFLFAVGVALALSFPRSIDGTVWMRIARRTLLLIGIGWGFQLVADPDLATFRIPGVLQRIALCYALAASLAILTARKDEAGRSHLQPIALLGAALVLLAGYWALLGLVRAQGYAAGDLSPSGNLTGYIDRMVFTTAHMWSGGTDAAGNVVYDPEGLLSTFPALANTLFGMLAALLWRRAPRQATRLLVLFGAILLALGMAIAPAFPLNKKLWTSSFALFTSGLSTLILALCMIAARYPLANQALAPFYVFGKNAILGYMLSLAIGIAGYRVPIGGVPFQQWAFERLAGTLGDPYLASFTYAVLAVLLVLALLIPLHRRGIHLRL
jgi:predicted acyltransferase